VTADQPLPDQPAQGLVEHLRRDATDVGGRPLVVPFCAATPRARELTSGLVADIGCRPLCLGGLDRAGQLEAVAALGIRLLVQGLGFDAVMPSRQSGPPPGRQSSMAW
jgi:predicted dinucleotide-binding enzyme